MRLLVPLRYAPVACLWRGLSLSAIRDQLYTDENSSESAPLASLCPRRTLGGVHYGHGKAQPRYFCEP